MIFVCLCLLVSNFGGRGQRTHFPNGHDQKVRRARLPREGDHGDGVRVVATRIRHRIGRFVVEFVQKVGGALIGTSVLLSLVRADGQLRYWELDSGKMTHSVHGHAGWIADIQCWYESSLT